MVRGLGVLLLGSLCGWALYGQTKGTDLHWGFARAEGAAPVDDMQGWRGQLEGYYAYVPGVSGDAVRFDGEQLVPGHRSDFLCCDHASRDFGQKH